MSIAKWTLASIILLFTCPLFAATALKLDDLFPPDRVLDVQITIANNHWNSLRRQTRDRGTLSNRKSAPIPSPFTYFDAKVTIEGVTYPNVGLRKKGFLGSLHRSRPSLKIKLNHVDPEQKLGGLSSLTFNNNKQDDGLISQYLSYSIFNTAGSPAPRCAFAHVTVNGNSLGVYSHVETVRKPLLLREFGTDQGTLYEGTIVDFHPGWENSFELKTGEDAPGRRKIAQVIQSLQGEEGSAIVDYQAAAKAWVPNNPTHDLIWTRPNYNDEHWKTGRGGAGYETQSGYQNLIHPSFNFRKSLNRRRASIYLRLPFEITNLPSLERSGYLALRVRYDDGFVAYLNGTRVASANAPRTPKWNSLATSNADDDAAKSYQPFDLDEYRHLLREGKNVLAVQGLNVSNSSDMLIAASLRQQTQTVEQHLAEHLDMDAFYRFWAIEGLLGFWDGYSGNRNNFFCYLNPENEKLYFLPWGADSLFTNESLVHDLRGKPKSVKTFGAIASRLWSTKTGRQRYANTIKQILDQHWHEDALLTEADRLAKMLAPYVHSEQRRFDRKLAQTKQFIRNRRQEVTQELNLN